MYEITQYIHFLLFAGLVFIPGWRVTGGILTVSALVYIGLEPQFDAWNKYPNINPFITRMTIDAIVLLLIGKYGGKSAIYQSIILAFNCLLQIAMSLEFYTQSVLVYNIYVPFSLALNVLQILLGIYGLGEYYRKTVDSDFHGWRHSFERSSFRSSDRHSQDKGL